MAMDLEHRIKRLEKAIPQPPCSHPGLLIRPTDEEIAEADRQLAACPRCSTSKSSRPHLVVIIHERPTEPEKIPEPNTLEIGSA